MDIDKIKEAVTLNDNILIGSKGITVIYNENNIPQIQRKLLTLITLATQVIEVSEAMPAKKELPLSIRTCTGESIGGWEAGYAEGFNLCHDEFVLWLTKRLDETDEIINKWVTENRNFMMTATEWSKCLAQAWRNQILGRRDE